MDTRPIGVFDSGLGGLTAVRQLRRLLPGEDTVPQAAIMNLTFWESRNRISCWAYRTITSCPREP